jgi:polyisoprenoid-binding protein YceI
MKRILNTAGFCLLFFFSSVLFVNNVIAQVKYHAKDDLNLLVSGTSTLHEWDMKEAKGEVNAVFAFDAKGQITGLTSLSFTAPAEGLKSEHSGMDKNAYKALKTTANPNFSFVLTNATVTPIDASSVTVKAAGKLTVAGFTKDVVLVTVCKINADKSISVNGTQKISMSDYKIEPPTFMFGAVKTGNDITLKFSLTIRK